MTSKYLKCDGCGTIIDRLPIELNRGDGAFHSASEIRNYAFSVGWRCIAMEGYNAGLDYCPSCLMEGKNMAHVFEGKPDERQAETAIAVSRFRPRYRALTDDEKKLHDELKAKADELDRMFAQVKDGRYKSLAITALEQSIMRIVKELTS